MIPPRLTGAFGNLFWLLVGGIFGSRSLWLCALFAWFLYYLWVIWSPRAKLRP